MELCRMLHQCSWPHGSPSALGSGFWWDLVLSDEQRTLREGAGQQGRDMGTRWLDSKSQLCHVLAVWL